MRHILLVFLKYLNYNSRSNALSVMKIILISISLFMFFFFNYSFLKKNGYFYQLVGELPFKRLLPARVLLVLLSLVCLLTAILVYIDFIDANRFLRLGM